MKSNSYISLRTVTLTLIGYSFSANSVDFSFGEVDGTIESKITISNLWSTQSADKDFIYSGNGGTSIDPNADNGRLNYSTGTFSTKLQGSHELSLNYKNYGAFVRGSYFYDTETVDETTQSNPLGSESIDSVGKDAEIFDAFVYGSFDIGKRALDVRLGKQTINWGESFFTPGGINVANPFEVKEFRVPGSELKSALLPLGALSVFSNITENISLSAYYQYEWDPHRLDPTGTFFSDNDIFNPDSELLCLPGTINDQSISLGGTCVPRLSDDSASDVGQYGINFTWFAEELNGTEFNFYHINYHSRSPVISATAGEVPNAGAYNVPAPFNTTSGATADANYFLEYPEDIKLYGLGFNTATDFGFTLQGEIALHKDKPIQYATGELLSSAGYIVAPCTLGPFCPSAFLAVPLRLADPSLPTSLPLIAPGENVQGYERLDVVQITNAMLMDFHNVLGGTSGLFIFEVAGTKIKDMPSDTGFYIYDAAGSSDVADDVAWGYRFRVQNDYELGPVKVTPSFAFFHDVNGSLPANVGPFIEDSKQASLGVTIDYQDTMAVSLAYNTYWGAGTKNPFLDRDFVGLSVNYWY